MSPRKKATSTAPRAAAGRRPSWQGSISFGLVHFPVALYGVGTDRRIAFHQLHDQDGVRIKQKRVCPADGEEGPYDHIVKGYEIEPGRYIVIEPDELNALSPERSRTIELEKFIDAAEIDPLYYDANYYVMPAEGAEAPYALLRDAMLAEKRAAVARLVIHAKEHLVALWPRGDTLVVSTLRFADEVTDPESLPGADGSAKQHKKAELAAARQLVSALSGEFDITDYRDEYREAVLSLIEAKARGRKVTQPRAEPERKPATDLMSALQESLASVSGTASSSKRAKPRRRGDGSGHRSGAKAH